MTITPQNIIRGAVADLKVAYSYDKYRAEKIETLCRSLLRTLWKLSVFRFLQRVLFEMEKEVQGF